MLPIVLDSQWLNTDEQLTPGTVVFESTRRFQLWAQTVSHGQLLLRSPRSSQRPTRVEVLFKPVDAQKIRASYDGMTIRCATDSEIQEYAQAEPDVGLGPKTRLFLIDSRSISDWVVAMAVGWREDTSQDEISSFVHYQPDEVRPIRVRTLDSADGGLSSGLMPAAELIAAMRSGRSGTGAGHAFVHAVLVTVNVGGLERTGVAGAFLTHAAAEEYLHNRPADPDVRVWIETIPVSLT